MNDQDLLGLESQPSKADYLELQDYLLDSFAIDENIPSGILHRCTVFSTQIRDFDGKVDGPTCSQNLWEELYNELDISHHHGSKMIPLKTVKNQASEYVEKGLTPIFISDFEFEIVRPRFWKAIDEHLDSKLSADSFPMSKYSHDQIIESRRTFFATTFVKTEYEILSALPRVHRGLKVSFVVPKKGIFTNYSSQFDKLEVDFGNGDGFQSLKLEEIQEISYSTEGIKTINIRCITSSGINEASLSLEIVEPSAPKPDKTWKLAGYEPYDGKTATGHAWVYYGSVNGLKNTGLIKPIIIAEGFPGNYSLDYLWDRLNQQSLATNMLNKGYDLIILGFSDGTLPIQANAYVTITCIQRAAAERLVPANPLQVGGASMGGLVTRYALTYMEHNNIPHNTSQFFTIDSPHGGATIAPSAQAFVQYTASYSAAAQEGADKLSCAAAQQMLLVWISPYKTWGSGRSFGISPMRTQFINDLRNIGWMPKKLVSAAVSDGVGTGAQNGSTPGALTASFESTACIWDQSHVYPLGGTKVTFAYMEISKVDSLVWTFWVTNGPGYDTMPGGQTDVFKELAKSFPGSPKAVYPNACFIPTVSACAVNIDAFTPFSPGVTSDFDHFKYSNSNLSHIELSAELATYLVDFITKGS